MTHELFMRRALALAYSQLGNVSPNPSVGAVIVKDGKIIAEGVTQKPGGNHAEIDALRKVKPQNSSGNSGVLKNKKFLTDARGATLYVTLEPCCHAGKKTPPCVDAIIKAGISRVVVGTNDKNPAVNGRGIEKLKKAGIEVVEGMLQAESEKVHEFFFHWITTKKPFVTVKAALTLDGSMTWGDGVRKKITGDEADRADHDLRRMYDAVLVGVNTVITDDPQLTTRLVKGRDPVRIVLDSRLRMPITARVLHEEGKTIVFCITADEKKKKELEQFCEIVEVKENNGQIDIDSVLAELGKMGIASILVEGGAEVIASFLDGGYAQKGLFFVAPLKVEKGRGFFSLLKKKLSLKEINAYKYGEDILIEGYI